MKFICNNKTVALIITHCDKYFASRAAALVGSLAKFGHRHQIVIFAHDDETLNLFKNAHVNNVTAIKIFELTSRYKELEKARENRSKTEFMFCVTPFLIKYGFEVLNAKDVWYVDADIVFFDSFARLENQTVDYSVLITSHNFPSRLKFLEKYGAFNVGILYARGDETGREIVDWWASKCIESTAMDPTGKVYGDQKYLDSFREISPKVEIFSGLGVNAAPWNMKPLKIVEGKVKCSDGSDLIAFHFSGLRRFKHFIFLGYSHYGWSMDFVTKTLIYRLYLNTLNEIESKQPSIKFTDSRKVSKRGILKMIRYKDFFLKFNSKGV
jgi:hypothetical protein